MSIASQDHKLPKITPLAEDMICHSFNDIDHQNSGIANMRSLDKTRSETSDEGFGS